MNDQDLENGLETMERWNPYPGTRSLELKDAQIYANENIGKGFRPKFCIFAAHWRKRMERIRLDNFSFQALDRQPSHLSLNF